jgi:N-acetylglucosamine-6-phosphate deacetylase
VSAYNAGMRGATHFMNAMKPMHHLEPSLVGAGLLFDDITIEIIPDGIHIRPEIVALLFRIKPIEKIILVTDSVWISGTPKGDYFLGDVPIINEGDRLVVKSTEKFSLAGSCISLDIGLKNVISFSSKPLEEVIKCITINPAKYIGVDTYKGRLAEGYDADINVLDENFNVEKTLINGNLFEWKEAVNGN